LLVAPKETLTLQVEQRKIYAYCLEGQANLLPLIMKWIKEDRQLDGTLIDLLLNWVLYSD